MRKLAVALGVLAVVASLAAIGRTIDFGRDSPSVPAAAHDHAQLPALSPDEESYAVALWSVHSAVKLAAVRMTFAGITYKTEGQDGSQFRSAIEPVLGELDRARDGAEKLQVPPSMSTLHDRYVGAIADYRTAAAEMLQGAAEGSDARLLAAQQLSFRASEETLRIGEQLWPTEHKPH